MTCSTTHFVARWRQLAGAAALVVAGAAQAAVGPAAVAGPGGGMQDIGYGFGGNVYQLEPMLFVQGLGSAGNPLAVTALNPALTFSYMVAGAGTPLMIIDYRVQNVSAVESFNQLRFMLFANPDGDPVAFADVLSETWGPRLAGDPDLREGRAFNPVDTILDHITLTGNLSEGYDAACLGSPGCDATAGLQWNAALLGPGETFSIVVGLSDNGQHLSSRWVDVTAVNTANTVLTLSGIANIIPVAEPGSGWMLAAGLAALGVAIRRRLPR